jgi:hypothetical protein
MKIKLKLNKMNTCIAVFYGKFLNLLIYNLRVKMNFMIKTVSNCYTSFVLIESLNN